MKKITFFLLLFAGMQAFAQNEYKHRYAGLGFKLGAFQNSELSLNYPVNRLFINIDPIKYARVDFQFGVHNSSRDQVVTTWPSVTQTFTLDTRNSVWMLGVFGQYWFDDMSLYLGARYGRMNYTDEDVEYDSFSGLYYVGKDKGTVNQSAVVLGGEYRFGKRFSVGAECSFLLMKDTFDPATSNINMVATYQVFETSAFFRFYPF